MATTSEYSVGNVRSRVSYNVTTSNTTVTVKATLEYYVTIQGTYWVPSSSDTLTMKVNGSSVGSKSTSWRNTGPVFPSDVSSMWYGSSTVTKTYTRDHSAHTYTLSFGVSFDGHSTTLSASSFTVPARASYSVTYNANGGSYAPSSQTKWYDETLTLTSSTPSRTGYVFWHWNTNSSNSGTTYNKGGSYTSNSSLYLYAIWNPVIYYNANGGTNAPPSQTKTYGTALTLSSTIPTRSGYQFLGWGTSQSGGVVYQAGGSYTSNSTATLYAQWRKVADPPTISSISVIRCNSSGTSDDMGTYCRLRAYWSVDTTSAGMSSNQGAVTGTIVSEDGQSRTITFSSGTSGTSGTAAALIPNCDTDTQYTVTVTVRNTVIGTGQSTILSTSRSDVLTRAFFTIDFAAGGEGVGIGTAAPREGFECGFDAQFNKDMTILGDVSANNLNIKSETGSNVCQAEGTFTMSYAEGKRYAKVMDVFVRMRASESLSVGSSYLIAWIVGDWKPPHNVGFANSYGIGYVTSGGYVYFRPLASVGSSTDIYVTYTVVE